jgi:hypothetical protein
VAAALAAAASGIAAHGHCVAARPFLARRARVVKGEDWGALGTQSTAGEKLARNPLRKLLYFCEDCPRTRGTLLPEGRDRVQAAVDVALKTDERIRMAAVRTATKGALQCQE